MWENNYLKYIFYNTSVFVCVFLYVFCFVLFWGVRGCCCLFWFLIFFLFARFVLLWFFFHPTTCKIAMIMKPFESLVFHPIHILVNKNVHIYKWQKQQLGQQKITKQFYACLTLKL